MKGEAPGPSNCQADPHHLVERPDAESCCCTAACCCCCAQSLQNEHISELSKRDMLLQKAKETVMHLEAQLAGAS